MEHYAEAFTCTIRSTVDSWYRTEEGNLMITRQQGLDFEHSVPLFEDDEIVGIDTYRGLEWIISERESRSAYFGSGMNEVALQQIQPWSRR